MKYKGLIILLGCTLFLFRAEAQFNIYVLKSRYDKNTVNYFNQNNRLYKSYGWIGESSLTPNRDGKMDKVSIQRQIDILYPDKNADGYLSIDLEGEVMKSLREGQPNQVSFKRAESTYINILKFIKGIRPNLKLGVYGLPPRIYYQSQFKNDDSKYDKILSISDFISPSIYILYTDEQKGQSTNTEYIKFNLKRSLIIGKRLNKVVIPYVWPVVKYKNSIFVDNNNIITADIMSRYLNIIYSYSYNGSKARGVLWWEEPSSSKQSYNNLAKKDKNLLLRNNVQNLTGAGQSGNATPPNAEVIINSTKFLLLNN